MMKKGQFVSRRDFLSLTGMVSAAVLSPRSVFSSESSIQKRKPNVLLIMADDMNNALGLYGHPMVKTPNLDRLASEGVRFDLAYCQYPLCNPSRASIMNGLRPDRTGVLNNQVHFREHIPDAVTLPQLFRNHGYYSMRIGKIFHYGVPKEIGTDGVMDDAPSWDGKFNPTGWDKEHESEIFTLVPGQFGGTLSWLASDGTDEEQTDGIGAGEAVEFLEENRDRPFFLALGFYRPHTPYVAPRTYFDEYPLENIHPPFVPEDDDDDIPAAALRRKPEEIAMSDEQRRQAIQAYYACNTFVDTQVGRVLDTLDRLNLRDNTIVVFTSDHGYQLGEHHHWQKMTLFEPAARVPLIVSAPGMNAKGQSVSNPVELIDLYPTLAELCGLTPPETLDGISLAPLLNDPSLPTKPGAVTQVIHGTVHGYSIRTKRYRYTEWDQGNKGVELYDHQTDPDEFHNRADDPEFRQIANELKVLLYATLGKQKTD